MRAAALLLVALALTGCETTQEKSAKLERAAKRAARTAKIATGLSIVHPSTQVAVVSATLVRDSEGSAAVVTLHNRTGRPLRDLPLEITVRDAGGQEVYANSAPGLAPSLVSASALGPHGQLSWVNDQVTSTGGTPASVSATVGRAAAVSGTVPRIGVEGVRLSAAAATEASAEGTVVNHSTVAQSELVVYAVARRAGRVVAAGRAIVQSLAAGASASFQAFLIGAPSGSQLTVTAPPTTFG